MALSTKDVRDIAKLAKLQIKEDELGHYKQEISRILEFVEQMNQADVENVEPMAHPQDMMQSLRVDEIAETNQREKFQKIAPATQDGLYLVPKVIE
jgi:aspartyl-tRNA(Asn)/glutamyl-tRNA(Gln) amidotransferase subunit C